MPSTAEPNCIQTHRTEVAVLAMNELHIAVALSFKPKFPFCLHSSAQARMPTPLAHP